MQIVFDLGGVLVDVQTSWAQQWLQCSTDELERAFFGERFQALTIGRIDQDTFLYEAAKVLRVSTAHAREAFCQICRPRPSARALLSTLKVPFVIWSNINVIHFNQLKTELAIDEQQGHALSFRLGIKKPDKEFFRQALDLVRDDVWFFDDRHDNVQQAKLFGISAKKIDDLSLLVAHLDDLGLLHHQRKLNLV